MTSGKLTIDNSVRYLRKSEQSKEKDIKPKKTGSLARKQNKNISQNIKKFLHNVSASGFNYISK